MITYNEVILLLTLLVQVIALVINIEKRNKPPKLQLSGLSLKLLIWANRLIGCLSVIIITEITDLSTV